ncbi:hypothetical protein [Corynebacterium pseudopelargi]|uniref:Uncharacterized protein n=1 Tax=Corynebacterium pseudopelargi TaxID=2080757 RepID=A0A3G6ISM2_9CORY|nr:hypothetical protein [Corynebacterium pseudopelargi]AZA08622.1 hypothetical protein CPPEL_02430 [Corynebacterium pseudopelargi]
MSISRVFDAYVATRDVPDVESTFGELDFEYGCAAQGVEDASEAVERASDFVFSQLAQDSGADARGDDEGIFQQDSRLCKKDADPAGGEI